VKNNIKELRKNKKLSQQKLADLCNVTRQTVNAIENDKYDPTLQLAFSLSKYLDTTVDGLFIYEEEN
jgi:putative transcriptional regulator